MKNIFFAVIMTAGLLSSLTAAEKTPAAVLVTAAGETRCFPADAGINEKVEAARGLGYDIKVENLYITCQQWQVIRMAKANAAAIGALRGEVEEGFKTLTSRINEADQRIGQVENRVSALEEGQKALEASCKACKAQLASHHHRVAKKNRRVKKTRRRHRKVVRHHREVRKHRQSRYCETAAGWLDSRCHHYTGGGGTTTTTHHRNTGGGGQPANPADTTHHRNTGGGGQPANPAEVGGSSSSSHRGSSAGGTGA